MECLVAVINGFVLFSRGMRITVFDFCAPVNMICVTMSCWEINIESLSAVHVKQCTVKESKKISNDQELIQSDPTYCPQNQKGNN